MGQGKPHLYAQFLKLLASSLHACKVTGLYGRLEARKPPQGPRRMF